MHTTFPLLPTLASLRRTERTTSASTPGIGFPWGQVEGFFRALIKPSSTAWVGIRHLPMLLGLPNFDCQHTIMLAWHHPSQQPLDVQMRFSSTPWRPMMGYKETTLGRIGDKIDGHALAYQFG